MECIINKRKSVRRAHTLSLSHSQTHTYTLLEGNGVIKNYLTRLIKGKKSNGVTKKNNTPVGRLGTDLVPPFKKF